LISRPSCCSSFRIAKHGNARDRQENGGYFGSQHLKKKLHVVLVRRSYENSMKIAVPQPRQQVDEYRISPVPEPGKERPDYLKLGWLAGVAFLDPVKWLPELKTQKVRVQFVKTVAITPVEAQQQIEADVPANA
jgi:hypothetical protein